MNPISDTQPLTKSDSLSRQPTTTTVIRPKQPRRYKLLPRDKLKIPSLFGNNHHGSSSSSRMWNRDHYMKHMPLIAIDPDEDDEIEEFNGAIFTKVSNKDLRDLLVRDKPIHSQHHPNTVNGDNDDDDDWELCLAPPSRPQRRFGCPCQCTIS